MANSAAASQPQHVTSDPNHHPAKGKAIVVGIYGTSGSGKTYLLNQLKEKFEKEKFAFFESSQVLDRVTPGGLEVFKKLEESEKLNYRKLAITSIEKECYEKGLVGVVAGHFSFWIKDERKEQVVCNEKDLAVYTHILYLNVPETTVEQRRLEDPHRDDRETLSSEELHQWQQAEITKMRSLCFDNKILFTVMSETANSPTLLEQVFKSLKEFQTHTEKSNWSSAQVMLDNILSSRELETLLVFDGDKTLATEDTGALFWEQIANPPGFDNDKQPLKMLFSSRMGHSYLGFRQAALLYEEVANHQDFDALCDQVAAAVTMHSEFVLLLKRVADQKHVRAVVVTCGLRRVWEKVLKKEGLSTSVKVIGSGPVGEGFIVTRTFKASVVARAQNAHSLFVWAFGDGPLDIAMLKKANRAIVVVGPMEERSRGMEKALTEAIECDGLEASQVVLPSNSPPRLDIGKLPLVQLTATGFLDSVVCHRSRKLNVVKATDKSATKLLSTTMRDAKNSGPVLREAHRRAGYYLAIEYLADAISLEEIPITHVLSASDPNVKATGYQLRHEKQTLIVALMRGGEPMASGVNEAFPKAMLKHANNPQDLEPCHLYEKVNLVLVDSVVNTGKTVIDFVDHIRGLEPSIRIVVVAGVVQDQCFAPDSDLTRGLAHYDGLTIIALRTSQTKFTGSKANDTGNRLFNSTHLD